MNFYFLIKNKINSIIYKNSVPKNLLDYLETVFLSIASAISVILFAQGTNFIFNQTYSKFQNLNLLRFSLYSFITIAITSLLGGFLLYKISPEAAGSGIPQAKVAYKKDMGYISLKSAIIKFFGGILTIGGGTSLGREGPSVFLGAAISSNLSGLIGKPKNLRRKAILIGSASALAAAFNTPIAAILFVIEELVNDINNKYLGHVLFASVIGAMVVHSIIGNHPAFILPEIKNPTSNILFIVPVVATVSSLLGVFFQKFILSLRNKVKKIKKIAGYIKPFIGATFAWIIGVIVFAYTNKIGVFGLGYKDLTEILSGDYFYLTAGIMTLAKLIATSVSYAWGGCGGIFAPSLFIGASSAFFISNLFSKFIILTSSDITILTICGMSSFLATVVWAPLTSILIVFEMTHQFSSIPYIFIAVLISQIIARLLNNKNFYDSIIDQDGINFHEIKIEKNSKLWKLVIVKDIMNSDIKFINLSKLENIEEFLQKCNYSNLPVLLDENLKKNNVIGIIDKEKLVNIIKANINSIKSDKVIKIVDYQKLTSEIKQNCFQPLFCYERSTLKEVANLFVIYYLF